MSPFEELLKNLGTKMGIPLHADSRQSCALEFARGATVQIDLDASGDRILVASTLEIENGSFRTTVFEHALKWNSHSISQRGILSFSPKKNALVHFQFLPLSDVTPEFLYMFLESFVQNYLEWKQALNSGVLPSLESGNATLPGRSY